MWIGAGGAVPVRPLPSRAAALNSLPCHADDPAMMPPLYAIILGLVEGITEYLPVSSTGHLIIATSLLFGDRLDDPLTKASLDAFNIVIQGGAILAVAGLYRERITQMVMGMVRWGDPAHAGGRRLLINLIVAFLPAAVLGVLLNAWIEAALFSPAPVLIALAIGGVWMIWIDRWRKRHIEREEREGIHEDDSRFRLTIDQLDWRRALVIGVIQCVAMVPGTSRSMMTIAGGTILGLKPRDAAEFSFLLGLPTLGGACVYKLHGNLTEAHANGQANMFEHLGWGSIVLGMAVATVSAVIAIKWLVSFLTRHGLAPFGYYRLALAGVMLALILAGLVSF